jgi:hypothetical protein
VQTEYPRRANKNRERVLGKRDWLKATAKFTLREAFAASPSVDDASTLQLLAIAARGGGCPEV